MTPTHTRREALEDVRPQVESSAWARWGEVAGLTALALLLGLVADPADPLLTGHHFPWLALAPLAAALRYGSVHGLASGAVLALAVVVQSRGGAAEAVLGSLAVTFAAGLFRDAWARRIRQLEAASELRRGRLEGLLRAHRMLEESHQRLQRTRPGEPGSLRDALDAVRRVVQDGRPAGLHAIAGRTLDLFGELAHVHAAAFHPVDAAGRAGGAIAATGGCAGAEADTLVQEAIASRAVVSVRDAETATGLLAAIPIVDLAERVHGVVAVRDMPFFALNDETLDLLAILGGALGDALASRPLAVPDFRQELRRAARDACRHGVPSVLAQVRLTPGGAGAAAARSFAADMLLHRRLSDEVASLGEVEGTPTLVVLLRAAGAEEIEGYRSRLSRAAAQEGCGIELRTWALSGPEALRTAGEAEVVLWKGAAAVQSSAEEPLGVDHGAIPSPVHASRS